MNIASLGRLAIKEGVLSDGTIVPPGWIVDILSCAVHQDPSIYPNPDTFDPFRFAKLRKEADSGVKYGFVTLDNNHLVFGVGRHACPGRFLYVTLSVISLDITEYLLALYSAAMELKIILATILLHWDVSLPEGVKERPKNMVFQTLVMPPPKAELVFTKRSK